MLTSEELAIARVRIREWPREEREAVTRLTELEAQTIVLATALLDLRPTDPPTRAVHIDLRRKR